MLAVLIQVLPFFAVIAVGYLAGRTGFFSEAATAALTKFVFYFALSAMLIRFSANLNLGDVIDWPFIWAYLIGTTAIYIVATIVALVRHIGLEQAAVEAQCAVIGNTGFLGVPMLALLFGEEAIGPVMLCLAVDLVVFSSLIVILITGHRDGRVSPKVLGTVGLGLVKNPMIVSIVAGFAWSATGLPLPGPVNEVLVLLGAAATPGALFAIGASLASKSAERLSIAVWLSFAKLVLHPAAVAVMALLVFSVDAFSAKVMISAAALPVAGNVFILAQHYGVAPARVSAAILVSTTFSILTVAGVIALLG
ncbi:AEC family transporter [Maritimibacter sp. UBA3975]|uniref:AEC family transporter n=1 Tax=Maritimibacter sp. UBA3975 TaxID=1946833 RepID=UPI000C09A35E|nr:AEC family transporter [Maritimibacter sp. UBA3975]MAM61983.1 malate transporter [Maritimibacter sp.]|tara:strand:+ start:255 stop:1178 length:924 start_codon:yes stop_codon:yes gene_type:complete